MCVPQLRTVLRPLPATHKVDDLDAVALVDDGFREEMPLQNREVVLHRDAARIDGELRQKIGDRHRLVECVGLAVERDEQRNRGSRGTSSAYMIGAPVTIDRAAILDRFSRMRARTRALFALLDEGAYYTRPIPLRNPIVFYEGHLPA